MDTLGTALKALFVAVMAFNLLAWQHLVLGFDSRSIQMVNAMEILVALLAGVTVYRAFYSLMNDTIFPAIERMQERREKRNALVTCPCGRHHSV
jgi:uncharacterized metal-binding protein